jgi:putative transposase
VPRSYPSDFRRKVLDLVASGRPVAEVAELLGISDQTASCRESPAVRTPSWSPPASASPSSRPSWPSTAVPRSSWARWCPQKAVRGHRGDGRRRSVGALATRVLRVSESGFYVWRSRPPSTRSLRHVWLTEQITAIHTASRGIYGAQRVRAELMLGRGIHVGHGQVELLVHRAGLKGLPGNRRRRPRPETPTAADLVDRNFARTEPDRLWVTDITEHPTREGKVYCAVVLDTYSRRVVGWSIDATQTAALVTNTLSMAIANRTPQPAQGTIIHSDHGVQGGFNWSSQHLDHGGVRWGDRGSLCRRRRRERGGSGRRIGRSGRRCVPREGRSRRGRCSVSSGG